MSHLVYAFKGFCTPLRHILLQDKLINKMQASSHHAWQKNNKKQLGLHPYFKEKCYPIRRCLMCISPGTKTTSRTAALVKRWLLKRWPSVRTRFPQPWRHPPDPGGNRMKLQVTKHCSTSCWWTVLTILRIYPPPTNCSIFSSKPFARMNVWTTLKKLQRYAWV